MKLFIQTILLVAFAMSASAAPERKLAKSFAFSSGDGNEPNADGQAGCRQECSDKRFTMVCQWEATKKVSKSHKKSRRLGKDLDYEEETEDKPEEMTHVDVGGGRRLKVALKNVACILGVGKKDSDDSSEDYEEYKERLSFPSDSWSLKIKAAMDTAEGVLGQIPDYYSFTRTVEFEGIEDPNNSADELTIKGEITVELLCFANDAGEDVLVIDGQNVKFSC